MNLSGPLRHAVRSTGFAVAFGAVVAGLSLGLGQPVPLEALVGWGLATLLGVVCGARLVALHGTPGAGFLVAHGTCTLARLFAFAGGVGWALTRSTAEALAFIAGLVAGYLPTQVFELVWFARRTRGRHGRASGLEGTERE